MIYGSTKKIIVTHLIAWCTIEVDVDGVEVLDDVEDDRANRTDDIV